MSYKHERIIPNQYLPIKIFTFKSSSSDRIIIDHWHKSTELLYCISGQLNVWLNSKKYTLSCGDAIFINSNVVHSTQSPVANEVIVLQTPSEFMESVSHGNYNKERIINLNESIADTNLEALILEIYNRSTLEDWVDSIGTLGKISDLYFELFHHHSERVDAYRIIETQKYLDRLATITEYIRDNHRYELSLKDVADEFGFNIHYFARFFKKYMGITYLEYLNQIRLDSAHRLLMSTDKSVFEISDEAGFTNVKSFSSFFKKHYHVTPNKYRKSINDLNEAK